jgi:hypothetical protein
MKILGLSNQHSGCGFHRVVLPLGFMNDIKGLVTNYPTDEVFAQGWDIVMYNRLSGLDNHLETFKKELNVKLIVDMDDDWILPGNHLNYFDFEEVKPRIENNIRTADLVTCTNEKLAEKIYQLNQNVKIYPNALPYGFHQFKEDKVEDERVRIFWCGSCTHEMDMEILKYPVRRLKPLEKKIKMVLGGYTDTDVLSKKIWDSMFNNFTANGTLPYMKISGTTPDKYMQLYEYADICVIPLEKSDWHGCKSNLKILEAATKKLPVIVSAVEPYIKDLDAPVLWVHNQRDWFIHLKDLILNPNKRKDYGEALYEWAKEKYNIFKINEDRRSTFADIIKA